MKYSNFKVCDRSVAKRRDDCQLLKGRNISTLFQFALFNSTVTSSQSVKEQLHSIIQDNESLKLSSFRENQVERSKMSHVFLYFYEFYTESNLAQTHVSNILPQRSQLVLKKGKEKNPLGQMQTPIPSLKNQRRENNPCFMVYYLQVQT